MVYLHHQIIKFLGSNSMLEFLKALGPTIVSVFAIWISFRQSKRILNSQIAINSKSLNAQKDHESRQLILKKLNDFYGPLIQQRRKSALLYEKFSGRYREVDSSFSTLNYLLQGNKFEGNDKILLEQIIKLGEESNLLIQTHAGLIDDTLLRLEIIPKATTHFMLLKLAYEGNLIGDYMEFLDLTYPRNLIDELENRKAKLEAELNALNQRENISLN